MNLVLFLSGTIFYVYLSYLVVCLYFLVAVFIYTRFYKLIANMLLVLLLGCFSLFLFFELLFPAWLSEKLKVFERSSLLTSSLIIFGGVVIIATLWAAWISHSGRRFYETFRENDR